MNPTLAATKKPQPEGNSNKKSHHPTGKGNVMFAALTTLLAIPSLVGLAIGLILTFIDNTNSD